MSTVSANASVLPTDWSLAQLQAHLGGIAAARIRMFPPPGLATVEDVVKNESSDLNCELIDGVLVEKDMGYYESIVAAVIIRLLGNFADENDLGVVGGADGTLRILPDQVRMPDVWFISWDKFPDHKLPRDAVPAITPDLAIEVLSERNTVQEMDRKLRDY
ncbi:MAG: Uma2 family endonuclease, partial [Pirellulales bacterium]|nr:Uma2 family endonuclease [Pirellulales bacterium]